MSHTLAESDFPLKDDFDQIQVALAHVAIEIKNNRFLLLALYEKLGLIPSVTLSDGRKVIMKELDLVRLTAEGMIEKIEEE